MIARSNRGLLLVLLATALLYLPTLSADFVNFDDYDYVRDNPNVHHPELTRIFDLHTLTVWDWTPLVTLSHAAEYRLWGSDPRWYHATNLALHLGCTVFVYFLLVDLGVGTAVALLASLIFATHPLQVESVAWISARKNLLAALFGLGFCRAFLAGKPLYATLLLTLALGSKGTAIVFPAWVAAAAAFGFGAFSLSRAIPWLAVYGTLALGRGLLSAAVQAPVIVTRSAADMNLSQRMSVMGPVLATQLRQFFLPYDLSVRYFWSARPWLDPRVLLSWGVVICAVGACVWAARRSRSVAVCAAFAGIALLPTLNIVPAPEFQADRYVHLALVTGSVLGIALLRPFSRIHRWLPGIVLLLWWATVGVPATRARIAVWRNTETLWQDVLQRTPDDAFAWDSLGKYYLETGESDKAEPALRRALVLAPGYHDTRYNLALLLSHRGATAEAIADLRLVVGFQPSFAEAQTLLGQLLATEGQTAEGLVHLNAALDVDPANARARYQRAQLYALQGRLDLAAQDFEALLPTTPASPIFSGLAAVRLRQGRPAEAVELAQHATEKNAQQAEGWDVLGQALCAVGQLDAADAAVARGVAANPNAADLWYRLAKIRQQRGDVVGARAAAARALQLLPPVQPEWAEDARGLAG